MNTSKFFTFLIIGLLPFSSCKKEAENVSGCTDPNGDNYSSTAIEDDGSCTFQKRYLGDYTGNFACKDLFKTVFTTADLSITELINKSEVNIIIQTKIGPLPVKGTINTNTITVDELLQNVAINANDIYSGAGDIDILVDATIKTVLTISNDNKTLTGDLSLSLITLEDVLIFNGLVPLAKGTVIGDVCAFTGTKK